MIKTAEEFDLFTDFFSSIQVILIAMYEQKDRQVGETMILISGWSESIVKMIDF